MFLGVTLALQACAFVATYRRPQIPTRESLRPTEHSRELLLLRREVTQGRDLASFVDQAKAQDWVQSLLALWLVGQQAAMPVPPTHRPLGSDTYVSLQVDPSLAAAQVVATALTRQGLLAPLWRPWHGRRYAPPLTSTYTTAATRTAQPPKFVLRADLHVHSARSHDSTTPLRRIFQAAQANGIDVLAITDHDVLTYPEAVRVYRDMQARGEIYRPIVLIPGVEVSTSEGHLLAYFVHEPIPPGLDPAATVAMIHAQGGLAVIAHPHLPGSGIHGPRAWNLPVDGVERINGAQFFPLAWHADRWHSERISSRGFASSDAHFAEYVGAAYTEIAVTAATAAGVREAIAAGRLTPKTGNVLQVGLEWIFANRVSHALLRAGYAPIGAVERARFAVAAALGADDFYLRTTWNEVFSDLYSVIQALQLVSHIQEPRHAIHAPPLPAEVGLRYGSLALFVRTPLRSFAGYLNPEVERQTRAGLGIDNQRAWFFTNRRQQTFFVWPAGIVAGLDWSWIF